VKSLTREQLKSRKAKAVRFTRDVLGDDYRAGEIQTRRELLERIEELEGQNEDLQSKLDEIADLVAPDEEDEDEDEGE
jgi:hypothetical protein